MEAVEAFCDHLEGCVDKDVAPNPSHELLEAMSMQLALVLHRPIQSDALGPPVQHFALSSEPNAFDPIEFIDGDREIVFRSGETIISLDLTTGKAGSHTKQMFPTDIFRDMSRSPNGRFYTDRNDFVGVFEEATDDEFMRLAWDRNSAEACTVNVEFSPDSLLVAVSYAYDNAVRIWNVHRRDYLGELRACDHEAALKFSPDGSLLFTGTKSGARLFHLNSGYAIYSNNIKQTYAVGYHSEGCSIVADTAGPAVYRVDLSTLGDCKVMSFLEILQLFQDHRDEIVSAVNWKSDWVRLDHLSMQF
ncbi:MAG: WD40 repeat domain-containing protein [Hyphomonas sp.]|nr:WD40 repeat domain-containing protein [Hyphomonas sp.]